MGATRAPIILAVLLFFAESARPQVIDSSGLVLNVVPGVGDSVRAGATTPIQVTLQNGETRYDGRVTAGFVSVSQAPVEVFRRVELEPGATKRITLYLPATAQASRVRVAYETFRGPLGWRAVRRIEQNVKQLDSELAVFAGISAIPRGLPPDRDENNRHLYNRFFLQPDQLPDRQEGLDMFDVIFLSPPPTQAFTGPQVRALREWVLRGGVLIADASAQSEAYRAGRLGDLLPFIPQGNEQRKLDIFDRETLYATGTRIEGEVLLEANGVPLVMRRNYGLGCTVTFAIAPDDAALLSWNGLPQLWGGILGDLVKPTPSDDDTNLAASAFYGERYTVLANALAQRVTKAPSTGMRLGLVLLLTGLYALVAGPGDYLLVRKLKRPRLTWITFPLIVAFFTLAAYLGARYWIGGDWAMDHQQRTVVFPQLQTALRLDLTGVFVPQGGAYRIRSESQGMLRHIGDMYGLDDALGIDGDEGTLQHAIPIWTHRAYVSSETLETYPEIDTTWTWDNTVIEITNNSEHAIEPTYAIARDAVWLIRDRGNLIQPGATERIVVDRSAARPVDQYSQDRDELTGLAAGMPGRNALLRELNLHGAVGRGAQIVVFNTPGSENPLNVDGAQIENTSSSATIQVVTYPTTIQN